MKNAARQSGAREFARAVSVPRAKQAREELLAPRPALPAVASTALQLRLRRELTCRLLCAASHLSCQWPRSDGSDAAVHKS
eukprot:6196048-Pleurochrysis_carterae.AAC.1